MRRWWPAGMTAAAVVAVVAVVVGSCGGGPPPDGPSAADGVRIASFDFDESRVLADVYAQAIEASGVPVVRLGTVGPREIVAPALEQGLIDVVPEYLGTAGKHFGTDGPVHSELVAALRPRGLTALELAAAQDVNVMVVAASTARRYGLERISDLAAVDGGFRIGGPVECAERPLCLLGLRATYGLEFAEFVPQRSLDVTAEALRRGEIDVGVMFSTAPQASGSEFVVLADDRELQPPENVVPIVRLDALDRWGPGLADTLNAVSASLTTDALRTLNRQGADEAAVTAAVAEWLRSVGLSG
jgi:osmoprotectant transport system substrate-binding protein